MPSAISDERPQIRREMRRRRRELSTQQQRQAAANLLRTLRTLPELVRARRIALYLANDGEIDLSPVQHWLHRRGKALYLPVLHPILHNRLWFARWTDDLVMTRNRYGIAEPDLRYVRRIPGWSLNLVLLPLVAFDATGGRLGMGGGYYDRTFGWMLTRPFGRARSAPKLMGIAHHFQEVGKLPLADWDVPLGAVATDRHVFRAGR